MCKAEAEATPEIYKGDEIESIRFFGNKDWPESIEIRLKNNDHIGIVPILNVFQDRHQSMLKLVRGKWIQ